jgi:hypothetical protein
MKKLFIVMAALAAIALIGCDPGTVSQDDMEQVRKEMGTEAYEKAMIDAGKGDELEAQKAADAARMAEEGGQ